VVACDIDELALAALARELSRDRAVTLVTDVTDGDAVRAAVRTAVDRFGGLDIVFANAGVFGEAAPIVDYPEDVFDRVMAVNVRGSFLVAKHALAQMRNGGSLIFNSSVVGLTSDRNVCAYATSKHALVGLMRTAVREVADRGIRVNTVHPGPVNNAFQRSIETRVVDAPASEAAARFEEGIPLGRHARAEEVAEAVLFLAADQSTFMTGARLALDGGMSV
jgi:NAD(P)-dependent dehydrogenase (short-subunit alcohol dehydrogenase family)